METPATSEYPVFQKLLTDGATVLGPRRFSGNRVIHDPVSSHLYHKWVMDCIGRLRDDAPEHIAQIKAVHQPNIALYHQAEQIFAILASAVELLRDKKEDLSRRSVSEKSPAAFSSTF